MDFFQIMVVVVVVVFAVRVFWRYRKIKKEMREAGPEKE
jgi:uncharacterized membrane protein SirB2